MSQQKGISFKEFWQRFQTEEACEAYLFEQHWPGRFVCSKCGGCDCYQLRRRREYAGKQCRRQTGTVLHRTHLPLTVLFWVIYLVAHNKRGISASQLSRELEIAYSSGIIELDDAYFGAPTSNGKHGQGTDKVCALGTVSLTDEGLPASSKYRFPYLDAKSVRAVAQ